MTRLIKCCLLVVVCFVAVGYSKEPLRVMQAGERKKVQLWADGPYWAETNVGAEKPWDYGYYFWWGDTVGYKRVNDVWVASDGSSTNTSFNAEGTPNLFKDISILRSERWITSDNVLAPEHDAAHVQWGGRWRMPMRQDLVGLNNKCDWIWTATNGVNGYIVRGRGAYASASIFLPAAGYGLGSLLNFAGTRGNYWSSVPHSDDSFNSWHLNFYSSRHFMCDYYRIYGQSLRPVQGFAK